MRALYLLGPEKVEFRDLPVPQVAPGEVLLRVKSVGVCASDSHRYLHGRLGEEEMPGPLILGHEFSAEVVEVASGVERVRPGQRVAVEPARHCGHCEMCRTGHPNLCPQVQFCGTPPVDGSFREYMAYPAELLYPLPDGISYDEGALLEPLGVALHSVRLGHFKPGWTAAILGAGPIGLCTLLVLRVSGAAQIIVTDPLEYRLELARRLGADHTLNPSEADVVEAVSSLTHGRGVDVVFEAAGVRETPEQAVEMVRPGGIVVLIGIPVDEWIQFKSTPSRRKGLTIYMVRRMKHVYEFTIPMLERGLVDVRPLISHVFPFSRAEQALATAVHYRDNVVKAIVHVDQWE
ncbi:MAG: NAD(P)-dependent alcohol dehydrogenase [candidate division KSB1 bacterium]|nr:NAD(P)-dependent alcohol dehydrogenase [candidate division KSB1 bacterium]